MASRFAAAMAAAEPLIDAEMGDAVSIVPMRRSDFSAQIDNERPVIDCAALVSYVEPSSESVPGLDLRVAHEEVHIEIRRALIPGERIAKGDEVILLDAAHMPRLMVTRVDRLDPYRLRLVAGPLARD